MKALVGAFNQEKALVGAFSVIVQPVMEPMDRFTALIQARGDKMVAAITNQRKVLDQLERRTEEVQQRRLGLEEASRELEGNRTTLELEISQLKEKKKDMEESMKTNEQKLSR